MLVLSEKNDCVAAGCAGIKRVTEYEARCDTKITKEKEDNKSVGVGGVRQC